MFPRDIYINKIMIKKTLSLFILCLVCILQYYHYICCIEYETDYQLLCVG